MGIFGFLKADKPVQEEKPQQKEKVGAASGGNADSVMAQGFQNVPHEDLFKAYIPGFLYKPPFGYPLNKNVIQLKNLAKNAYVFSVIRTLKDEASTSKWEIKLKKEFANEDQEGLFAGNYDEDIKKISAWFYNPNGNEESFNDIIAQWVVDLCEVDAAVGVKVFNKKQEFSQLFARDGGTFLKNCNIYGYMGDRAEFVTPLDQSLYIEVQPGQPVSQSVLNRYQTEYAAGAAYFQYGWSGVGLPVPFGRREIMYITSNARSDSIYGRSPIEILYDTLLTLIYGQQYNLDFYLNGNTPDGLLHLAGADQEIAEAMQSRMSNKFRMKDGLENERRIGHRYPVYGGPEANFIPFNLSAKDMEIIEQQKWFTKLVWSAFGVTPDEMGFTEDSNKAVSQTQGGVHKRKALKPLLKRIEYVVNSQLMPELDPSGKYEFCFEDYDIDEEVKKFGLYKLQVDMGVKTAEMVAEEEGINVQELKKQKDEQKKQEMEAAIQTNPGFLPEPKPTTKAKLKAEYIQMNLDDLIAEHKKLVDMLMNSNNAELQTEALDQAKELNKYIEMRKGEFSVGDSVKIMSGSKDHLGRIGYISKILNNGKEDYYEIRMGDMGVDLCFKENIKKINNPNTIAAITPETQVEEKPVIKSDEKRTGIVAEFEAMKEELLKRMELEDGNY